jgi:hypothetical protein
MKLLISILIPACIFGQTRGTSVSNYNFSVSSPSAVTLPPWDVAAGGTIVGCARFANSLTTTISVSDTGSANRFTVTNYANVGGNTRLAMFKAENTVAVAADVLKISFSSGGGSFTAESAVQYAGTAASSYDAGATGTVATATGVTSGAFTTAQGPEIAVACGTTAGTSVIPGNVGTTPMSIAAADSPNQYLAIEDANLYQIRSGITASMSNGSYAQGWGLVVGTFKSSNPVSPPTLSQSFSNYVASVAGVPYTYAGTVSTDSFTVINTNASASLSGIVFSDTLPSGMVVATPNGLTGSCPGGTVDAAPGTGTISLSGAALSAAATCTFSVNVASTGAGPGLNTTGNVTAAESRNGGTATAALITYGTPAITISNISQNALDHSSVNLTYSTSAAGYCQLQFGLASGTYIYSGGSAPTSMNGCQLSIGGLAPGTTYYVMPTVRPDANDTTGICQLGGSCGSTEQVFTTLPLPAVHPVPPTPPSVWTPVEPTTTSYTVVPMQASASDGTCVAASNVAKQANWSSSVHAGDSLQTVVNEIWFDTAIEFPEGSSCKMPVTGQDGAGVRLPQYSPAGGPNDWVVIRTHPNAASDLPPFGVRTGPQYASKLASLVAQYPNMPSIPGGWNSQQYAGQIFECNAVGCNHFWIENLEMTHAYNTTLYPAGILDPRGFGEMVHVMTACSYTPNTGCTINVPATTPDHIVLDRIYVAPQPFPSRELACFSPGGNHWAILSSYCVTNMWWQATWPQIPPLSVGNTMYFPFVTYQNNIADTPAGMTTPAGFAGSSTTSLTVGTGMQALTTQSGLSYTPGGLVEIYNSASNYYMIGTVTSYSGTTLVASIAAVSGTGNSASSWALVTPATAVFSGAGSYTGTVSAWIGSSGLTVEYQPAAGVSVGCTGCTAISAPTSASTVTFGPGTQTFSVAAGLNYVPFASVNPVPTAVNGCVENGTVTSYSGTTLVIAVTSTSGSCTGTFSAWTFVPQRLDTPFTSQWWFQGNFNGSGTFNLQFGVYNAAFASPSTITSFRPIGIYVNQGQYGVFDNNYIQAIGQGVYNDALGPTEDLTWTHNYFYFPRSKMQHSGQWDGYGYSFRNVIEPKQALRAQYIGNIIDGSASFQNPGNAMYVAGSYLGPYSTGTQDINISSNVFKHLSSGFQMAGGGTSPGPPDSPQASRIAVTNNLWLDLNRDLYNNGGGGLASGVFSTYPMGSDINFSNNTVGLTKGSGPSLLLFGGASLPQTTVMGEGLLYSNNVLLTSLGGLDPIISVDGGQNPTYSNFPTNPTVPASLPAPAPAGTWARYLNGNFIHTGASISPSWSIGNNVIVGAVNNRAGGGWVDASRSDISSGIQSLWPAGDTTSRFPCSFSDTHCSGGTTLASRLSAIGWSPTMNLAGGNPNPYTIVPSFYNPGNIGANVITVNQATGVVQGISVNNGPTSLTFGYAAPDSRACSVDISSDGATWARMTDSGGAFARSLTFTGLTANTNYQYRIMCYFDQSAAYEFLPSQITSGTVTTAANIATTVYQTFTLPSGASKAVFAFAAANGTTVHQTCSSSPCSVSLSPGNWTRTLTFETSDSVPVGTTSSEGITIE